jgi:hypothetical protein
VTPDPDGAERGAGERERAPGLAAVVPFPSRRREPVPAALPETPARKDALAMAVVQELSLHEVELLLARRNAVTYTAAT